MPEHHLQVGRATVTFKVSETARVSVQVAKAAPTRLTAPARSLRECLESPVDFPPLRSAFTPDDHVAVVVAERVAARDELLPELLRYLLEVGLAPQNLTVLLPPRGNQDPPQWTGALQVEFPGVAIEVHDPNDNRRLSYLASTVAGRRIYLNRTLIDADQVVILGEVAFDVVAGYHGGMQDLFPVLSDAATRHALLGKMDQRMPGNHSPAVTAEAKEIGWLLGMPFAVQVIEAVGGGVAALYAGLVGPTAERAHADLTAWYYQTVDRRADLVVVGLSGDPDGHSIADIAQAFHNAARVVRTDGMVVVMTEARPKLGAGAAHYGRADSPIHGLATLRHQVPDEVPVYWPLAAAGQRAKLYLASALDAALVEDLFLIPVEKPAQVQKLIDQAESVVFLEDGHRSLVEVLANRRGRLSQPGHDR